MDPAGSGTCVSEDSALQTQGVVVCDDGVGIGIGTEDGTGGRVMVAAVCGSSTEIGSERGQNGGGGECINFKNAKNEKGLRKVIRHFTPSWFSITMGTGIASILLHQLPYQSPFLPYLSYLFFTLNILLFLTFTLTSILRYTLWPEIWTAMLRHPTQSLFLGTFPMGGATIINMIVFVCVPAWGPRAAMLAWVLWWIDAAVAVAVCVYLPWAIINTHEKTQLSTMTAVWLLPIVSTIVAAASGGIVANVLPNPQHQLWTVIVSYILWGTGVPLAMATLVIYFQRLAVHKLPPREVIVSVFLPLGPLGQGGFGIMQLGKVAMDVFPKTGTLTPGAGEMLYVFGFIVALIMWGFGLVWFFFAVASISRSKFPFNMGWWGFTFPIGVYAVSTATIGKELPSKFFSILGTILSVSVVLLWLVVAAGTLKKSITGELFYAPCLETLKVRKDEEAGKESKRV